ncbi:hypothetical protein CDN99_02460 [Roseateles aquatilis]|uniref:HTH LytTR-type domain-containing protein n=2 Tax=Roseateles aquatilis TaxID=431061 RepID=A0A246JMS1_9BURK|nr:hypothetical protein CDN99_02460 [Roseateles aquatilis]
MWLLIVPMIVRAADAKPLRWGLLRRHLPWHLLFALVASLVHVLGMVALRKLVYVTQGASYDFGNWPLELFYEGLKDVRSYAFVLLVVGAYRLVLWRWQGEASLLAEAPRALPGAEAGIGVGHRTATGVGAGSGTGTEDAEPATAAGPAAPESASRAEPMPEQPAADRPERLLVKKLGKEFLLPVDEIEWVQACGNYVNLHRQRHDYPLRSSLGAFEQRLDPASFVRVHRSYLVRLSLIETIEPTEAGDAHLRLRDGSQVPCSRTYLERLRQRLV